MSNRTGAGENQYRTSTATSDDLEEVYPVHMGGYHLGDSQLHCELPGCDVSVQATGIHLGRFR